MRTNLDTIPNLHILWKGKILDVCNLTLFLHKDTPNSILYELADNVSDSFIDFTINHKHVYETGTLELKNPAVKEYIYADADKLVALLEQRYASITQLLYAEELAHGLRQ